MERSLRSRTQTWTTISILGALLVIGAVDWLGYRSLATTLTAGDWSRHALLVLRQAEVVLGELRDAETAVQFERRRPT